MINEKLKFLEEDHAKCLSMHMAHIESQIQPTKETMFAGSKSVYADPVFENLLSFIKPKVEKSYGKELVPTYSFWRTYFKTQDCPPHKDRPSCEVSVTLCIDASDKKDMWPISVEDQIFKLNVGEGVIYNGCVQEHWRHELAYDWHRQVFLHYIEKNGQFYPEFKYDKRPDLYTNMMVTQ
tara:strand:+ start:482 stop:1021 length:540 start_codon:yes stop_codon:yes gene_type:complete